MSAWGLLDEKEELELHKHRLLLVEERPFKRITKRLAQITTVVQDESKQDPTEDTAASDPNARSREFKHIKEDLTLDFAAFDNSISRLHFLATANKQEREGYEEKRQRILADCQAVRDKNTILRARLEESKATLAQRLKFDELANKITSNRLLRPREDQRANLLKLEEECRELERESETYSATWRERRDQFNRIMEEGMLLRRQIRDEKEEVDRREGMNEEGEEDVEVSRGGQTPRHIPSGNATPQIEAGTTVGGDRVESLKPRPDGQVLGSRVGSRAASRDPSPKRGSASYDLEPGEDVEMGEISGGDGDGPNTTNTPQVTINSSVTPVSAKNGDKMEVD